ncbi:hypothetical protein EG329_001996 [Mollisiaceae sp. DMI_Dod_QoI]|nr:hypothetical protein EG329_001996 [Helotiales sp. DMI_Dod_QoI]
MASDGANETIPADLIAKVKPTLRLRVHEAWKKRFSKRTKSPEQLFGGVSTKRQKNKEPTKVTGPVKEKGSIQPAASSVLASNFTTQKKTSPSAQNQETSLSAGPTRVLRGTRNECKTLDVRYTKKGDYELTTSTDPFQLSARPEATTIFDEYCMIVTRRFDQEVRLISTTLKIQSPFLIKAFRALVSYYPDNPVDIGSAINVKDPPALIFHYRTELAEYARREEVDHDTKLHIDYVLEYLQAHIGDSVEQFDNYRARGLVNFHNLWMMFRSGNLVYSSTADQIYYFERGELAQLQDQGRGFLLYCKIVNYDGKTIGRQQVKLFIPVFESPREITSLEVMPIEHSGDVEKLKSRLIERAALFLGLRGIHTKQHTELGRVTVDCKTYLERVEKSKIEFDEKCKCICPVCKKEIEETSEDYDHQIRMLSEQDMLIASSTVLGFSLSKHTWEPLRISALADVQWTNNAVQDLVMDSSQKKVILSLVTSPVFMQGQSTDIIGWKGKGLVVLLHGTPGTGKTLTAECVCEHLHRPLYIVTGGELGTTAGEVDKTLKGVLQLSIRWNAIILIDEADVFLEQRSATDITRNSLVSIFLRQLEYFEGMLFLTTNRVERFDDAFTSRIHLALNFPDLSPEMRLEIWVNSLKRLSPADVGVDLDGPLSPLRALAKEELNGRVISYAVRTAKALADADGGKLTAEHLKDVVEVYKKFNRGLTE